MATNGEPTAETIGARLRRLRTERRLSQRELAAPGVSYAYISRIEAGTRQPSVKALRMLARKLGVSADYLETGVEIGQREQRELRLANSELQLRLSPETPSIAEELRDVLDEAFQAGDREHASRARTGLGLVAAHAGRHDDTIALLEAEVEDGLTLPEARPDVYATLGRAYAAAGVPQRAVKLFERCLEDVRERTPDDHALQVRYASYLSFARSDAGDFEGARTALTDVLDTADHAGDPYTRVRAYWGLARLHGTTGNPRVALDYYRRAIALLESTDDTLHLARAHLAAASVLVDDDRADEAASHLEKAERLFDLGAENSDLAYLRTEQARHAIRAGHADEATRRAREALELLGTSEPAEQGTAWVVLAEALALNDEIPAATDAFGRAVDLLGQGSRWKECSRAYRAWGRMLRAAGRESEALDAFEKAAELGDRATDTRVAR